jgi:capsular exopolysaccharide synthesis family protein
VDLIAALAMLRRRWLAIVLCILAGAGGGYDLGHHGTKEYQSTAQALVNIPAAGSASEQLAGAQLSISLVGTYAGLVNSQVVQQQTANTLRAQGVTNPGAVVASPVTGTYLVNVTSTDANPQIAQATANAAAQTLTNEVAHLQAGLPDPISVHVVSPAGLPGKPVSPDPRLDLTIGLILGLLGGLALAGIFEVLDRSIKSVPQADSSIGAPMLGLVPRHRGKTLVLGSNREGAEGEPYRSLRTAVRFLDPDRPLRSLLVSSPTAGDGKTTTAANLAIALALSGERVIVVDGDLRRAGLTTAMGLERSVGLTSVVMGRSTIEDACQEWAPNLLVLTSGPLPPNPSEILGSQAVAGVIRNLEQRCDIVIIDTPPILPVADAVALGAQVDAVVLVVRHGSTPRTAAAAARRRLESVGARVVGYVLNVVPRGETTGYYVDYQYRHGDGRSTTLIGEPGPQSGASGGRDPASASSR